MPPRYGAYASGWERLQTYHPSHVLAHLQKNAKLPDTAEFWQGYAAHLKVCLDDALPSYMDWEVLWVYARAVHKLLKERGIEVPPL